MRRLFALVWLLVIVVGVAYAQGDSVEVPTQSTIAIDETVSDTITESAVFDLFEFSALRGDRIRATMIGSDGLAPLLGIRGTSGDIITRSDLGTDGIASDAPPNGTAILEFEIPEDGVYFLVPTRVGTADGTTTGSYTLTLTLAAAAEPPPRTTAYQPVRFRCGDQEPVTAMSLIFGEDYARTATYRLIVIGLDGFSPYVRLGNDDTARCVEGTPLDGASLDLLSDEQVDADETRLVAFEFVIDVPEQQVFTAIGSPQTGRFVVVLEGGTIEPSGDQDGLLIGVGPLDAPQGVLDVYMLRGTNSRIDPVLDVAYSGQAPLRCDDAGYGDCGTVTPASAYSLTLGPDQRLTGQRLDAGARLQPGDPRPVGLLLTSANRAQGPYWLVVTGQLSTLSALP
jgi:hypothetical protein